MDAGAAPPRPRPQFVRGDLAGARPVEAGIQPMLGGGLEIRPGRGETELGPQGAILFGQCSQRAVVERGVGHHVDHRGSRGQHPVLDPKVRTTRHDVVDRAVPAVDGAVVQPQLRQRRRTAGGEFGDRDAPRGGQGVGDVTPSLAAVHRDPPLSWLTDFVEFCPIWLESQAKLVTLVTVLVFGPGP